MESGVTPKCPRIDDDRGPGELPSVRNALPFTLEHANTPEQYAAGGEIFTAYARFLGLDLEFQGFSQEMQSLHRMYGPPNGCLLLARRGEVYIGAVGLREFEPGVAEMKRMFVLPEHQGGGVGKALVEAFLAAGKALGYRAVKLDSVRSLDKALALYRQLGFVETAPYRFNPYPDAVFMERSLT